MLVYFEPPENSSTIQDFPFQNLPEPLALISRTFQDQTYFPGPGNQGKNPRLSRRRGNPVGHHTESNSVAQKVNSDYNTNKTIYLFIIYYTVYTHVKKLVCKMKAIKHRYRYTYAKFS